MRQFIGVESECTRVAEIVSTFADNEGEHLELAWFDRHLQTCAKCSSALAQFIELDGQLIAWGQGLLTMSPSPANSRSLLAARLVPSKTSHWTLRWVACSIAMVVAAFVMAIVPTNVAPGMHQTDAPFVKIPYLPLPDPLESTTVVQANVEVDALLALGYRIAADPEAVVTVDVLVGEDGRAHALRIPSARKYVIEETN